jgi:hypothetical protein
MKSRFLSTEKQSHRCGIVILLNDLALNRHSVSIDPYFGVLVTLRFPSEPASNESYLRLPTVSPREHPAMAETSFPAADETCTSCP